MSGTMITLNELDQKRVAVCYLYGDNARLYLQCAGTAKFENGDLLVDRGENEEAFCVWGSWQTLLKEIPSSRRATLGGAAYVVAIQVVARLEDLRDKRMAVLLWEGDKPNILVGDCKYSNGTLYVDRGPNRKRFVIYPDWYPRIVETSEQHAQALDGARFVVSFTVVPLPSNVDRSQLWDVGIKLPLDGTSYVERSRSNDVL